MCRLFVLACLLVLGAPASSLAVDLEKLVMPGEVIRGHADIEAKCGKCHVPFRVEAQNALCLDCHTEVANDLGESTGFHGRAPGAAESDCRRCHTEHKGRESDVIELDREVFDHDFTDYPLRGGHLRAVCEHCHALGQKYRKASDECGECHGRDDVHDGKLGTRCGECHVERSWSETRFDHGTTRFSLDGKHRDVDCALCHPGEWYKNTARDCHGCHRLNDAHLGRFGPDCETCHSAESWKPSRFDHDRSTKFALEGRHRVAACEACHSQGILERKLSSLCIDCHRADDEHRGRNGPNCERCHGESSWEAEIFDHDRLTKFPLRGAHRTVKCQRCHVGTLYQEPLDQTCHACHESDDVHRRQEGTACERCHNESEWTDRVFFDHDLTRFPLLGLHAVSACEQCHVTPRFKDAEISCIGCHEGEDVHLQRLGPACEQCHNPNGWSFWRFDHAAQTDYPLRGAHADLVCHACHRATLASEIDLPRHCEGCHARDDVHSGAFGRSCERCHRDSSWDEIEMIR